MTGHKWMPKTIKPEHKINGVEYPIILWKPKNFIFQSLWENKSVNDKSGNYFSWTFYQSLHLWLKCCEETEDSLWKN